MFQTSRLKSARPNLMGDRVDKNAINRLQNMQSHERNLNGKRATLHRNDNTQLKSKEELDEADKVKQNQKMSYNSYLGARAAKFSNVIYCGPMTNKLKTQESKMLGQIQNPNEEEDEDGLEIDFGGAPPKVGQKTSMTQFLQRQSGQSDFVNNFLAKRRKI